MEAIVEAFCKGRGSGSTWRGRGFNSAMILTGFNGQTASNFCHDRASIVILELRQSSSAQVGSIPRRKMCDRGSIPPRSWGFFHALSAPSDDAPAG